MNLLRFGENIRVSEGGNILVTVALQPGSGLDENAVVDTLDRIRGLTAMAVIRGGHLRAPRGGTRFPAGDPLLAMSHPDVHQQLLDLASRPGPIIDSTTY